MCVCAAWIGGQSVLLTYFLGPFSASLVTRWGARPVLIVGSLLFAGGLLLTALTNNVWQAILTYGVITGIGGSMIYTPSVSNVMFYFHKRRALAACISQTGPWIGNLILVPISQSILTQFGWRAVCLFQGGLCLLMVVMSTTYRPRPVDPNVANIKPTAKQIVMQALKTCRRLRYMIWVSLVGVHFFSFHVTFVHLVTAITVISNPLRCV